MCLHLILISGIKSDAKSRYFKNFHKVYANLEEVIRSIALLDLGWLAAAEMIRTVYYCNCLYGSLQKNATAGFVTGKFAKVYDVMTLGWLPIKERIELAICILYVATHE